MKLEEAREYIANVTKKGSVLGLESTKELLKRLDNPEKDLKIVHIAGTNGKGSALAFISQILSESGYKVGRYISPVLFSYNEKIQINGQSISDDKLVKLVEKVKTAADSMVNDGIEGPTVFEIETAMAFLYFKEEACDISVIEVGMGGSLDSTNVILSPLVSLIMSISLDHVGVIGNNLKEIAKTKAGIIKKNSNTVLYEQSNEVMDVIKETCLELNSPLTVTDTSAVVIKETSCTSQLFDYKNLKNIEISLAGEHQIYNSLVAIEAAYILNNNGFSVSEENIRNGLKNTYWPRRFEIINKEPFMIIDGAHNPDGAKTFRKCVDNYLSDYYKIFVFGVLADKDYPEIIKITCDAADEIYTVDPDNSRALSDIVLADKIKELIPNVKVISAGKPADGINKALAAYNANLDKNPVVVVFGSLSFLGKLS